MKSWYVVAIRCALVAALAACSSAPVAPTAAADPATKSDLAATTASLDPYEICGSMKPLLRLLPTTQTVEGLPEIYRGCDMSTFGVKAIYAAGDESHSQYIYSVQILDVASPYLATWLETGGALEPKMNLRKSVLAASDKYTYRMHQCRIYQVNPLIQSERNPAILKMRGLEICVMDDLDANKEVWSAVGIDGKLGLLIEVKGAKARAIETTAAAKMYLVPSFDQFNIDAVQ